MVKKPKIKYIDRPTYFHADIELDMPSSISQMGYQVGIQTHPDDLIFKFDCNLDALMSYMMSAFPILKKAHEDFHAEIAEMHGFGLSFGAATDTLPAPALWTITFEDVGGKMEMEEKPRGVALNLFAALGNVMEKFIKAKKPLVFEFSAEDVGGADTSRMKLYDLLARKISKKAGYDVKVKRGIAKFYLFTKKGLKHDWWREQHYIEA
jgi:hypothetical protein